MKEKYEIKESENVKNREEMKRLEGERDAFKDCFVKLVENDKGSLSREEVQEIVSNSISKEKGSGLFDTYHKGSSSVKNTLDVVNKVYDHREELKDMSEDTRSELGKRITSWFDI